MLQTYIKGTRGIYICVDNRDIWPFFTVSKASSLPRVAVLFPILFPQKRLSRGGGLIEPNSGTKIHHILLFLG